MEKGEWFSLDLMCIFGLYEKWKVSSIGVVCPVFFFRPLMYVRCKLVVIIKDIRYVLPDNIKVPLFF